MSLDANFPAYISQGDISSICNDIGEKMSVVIQDRLHAFTDTLIVDRLNREIDSCRELGLL